MGVGEPATEAASCTCIDDDVCQRYVLCVWPELLPQPAKPPATYLHVLIDLPHQYIFQSILLVLRDGLTRLG